MQRIILKPVEKAPVLTNVIVFIGLLVIFNSIAGWIFEHTMKAFPSPFPQKSALATKYFSAHEVGSAGVMLCVLAALYAFFRYTPIGLAMRAAAQNPDSVTADTCREMASQRNETTLVVANFMSGFRAE